MTSKYRRIAVFSAFLIIAFSLVLSPLKTYSTFSAQTAQITLDKELFTGKHGKNHIQGMAIDRKNGYIYYSFTTKLVKSDLEGNIIGSVTGLIGHLGSICFNEADGKIYGSLEYKHDFIGTTVIQTENITTEFQDGFYIAIFDVDKITEDNMPVDNIMTAAFLPEVLKDYQGYGTDKNSTPVEHKYGCSGIDGLCISPLPGEKSKKLYLLVAYGIYSDNNRNDNDHQVILCYDLKDLSKKALPLNQKEMHRQGISHTYKYFVYTGNTMYGIQGLAYDAYTDSLFMAVYKGAKETFTNYDIFAIDMTKKAAETEIIGTDEIGLALTLKGSEKAESDDIYGWYLPYGQFGLLSMENGSFCIAEKTVTDNEQSAKICIYDFDFEKGFTKKQTD